MLIVDWGRGTVRRAEGHFLVESAETRDLGLQFIKTSLKLSIQLLLRDDVVGSCARLMSPIRNAGDGQ